MQLESYREDDRLISIPFVLFIGIISKIFNNFWRHLLLLLEEGCVQQQSNKSQSREELKGESGLIDGPFSLAFVLSLWRLSADKIVWIIPEFVISPSDKQHFEVIWYLNWAPSSDLIQSDTFCTLELLWQRAIVNWLEFNLTFEQETRQHLNEDQKLNKVFVWFIS